MRTLCLRDGPDVGRCGNGWRVGEAAFYSEFVV